MKTWKLDRQTLKSWFWNLLIFVSLLLLVETWQSRRLVRGALPEALHNASLPTLDGGTRSLWSPEKFTVIYVFAPWCGVCRASGRNIERLPDGFHTQALALSWDQPMEVENFVKESGLQLPVLMGRETEEAALQIGAYPSYLIINTQGEIVKAWSGYTTTPGLWLRGWWARLWGSRG